MKKDDITNSMNFITLFIIFSILVLTLSGKTKALTIQGDEYPSFTPVDTQFAQSHGVLFSSNKSYVIFGVDGAGVSVIYGTDESRPIAAHFGPIEVTFVNPEDGVSPGIVNGTISAVWGDGGGDIDYLRMQAYNYSNELLGTVYSSGVTWKPISFTGNGIHRVVFDQAPGAPYSSDTALDYLSFPMPIGIPEPATLSLLALGGLLLRKKNRNT